MGLELVFGEWGEGQSPQRVCTGHIQGSGTRLEVTLRQESDRRTTWVCTGWRMGKEWRSSFFSRSVEGKFPKIMQLQK